MSVLSRTDDTGPKSVKGGPRNLGSHNQLKYAVNLFQVKKPEMGVGPRKMDMVVDSASKHLKTQPKISTFLKIR